MTTKRCSQCGEHKPLFDFYKHTNGLRPDCKLCVSDRKKQHYLLNRDIVLQRKQKYRENHRAEMASYSKKWRQQNPDKHNALTANHRAAKLQATPPWADLEDIQLMYEVALAFRLLTGQEYHVDHIIPLRGETVCGLHVSCNLRVIEKTDNLTKSNKLILSKEMMWD